MAIRGGALGSVYAEMRLRLDRFNADMGAARLQMAGFSRDTASSLDRLAGAGRTMQRTGTIMSTAVTLPLVAMGAAAVKTYATFEQGMAEVKAVSGATGQAFDDLSDKAKELGIKTRYSAVEAAGGMAELARAGFETEEILISIDDVLNLAAAGALELAVAAEMTSDVMNAFGEEASETGRYADVFAHAAANTATTVEQLGEAMSYAAPSAAAMGYTVEDTAGVLGLFSDAGIKGSRAGTTFEALLRDLRNTSQRTGGTLEFLSASGEEVAISMYEADGSMRPLVDIIRDLENGFEGMTDAQMDAAKSNLVQSRGLRGLNVLLGYGADELEDFTAELYDSEGAGQEMAETMMDTMEGALLQMKASIEAVALAIGEVLTPYIRRAAEWIKKVADRIAELDPRWHNVIVVIGLLLAALGPLLLIVGTFLTMLPGLAMAWKAVAVAGAGALLPFIKVIAVIAAVVAVGYLLVKNWDRIKEAIEPVIDALRPLMDRFRQLWASLRELDFSAAFDKLKEAWAGVQEHLERVWQFLQPVLEEVAGFVAERFGFVVDWVQQNLPLIQETVDTVFTFISNVISTTLDVVQRVWERVWPILETVIIPIWNAISTLISTVMETIFGIIKAVMQMITGDWEGAWETIKETASNLLSGLWDTVVALFGSLWEWVKETVADAWAWVVEKVEEGVESVVEWFSELPERVGEFLVDLFVEKIPYWIGFGIGWMINRVIEGIAETVEWFRTLPGRVLNWLTRAIENIRQWARDMRETMRTRASEAISAVVDWFARLPGRVRTWLQNTIDRVVEWGRELPNRSREAGSSMVDSFIDTIRSIPGRMGQVLAQVIRRIAQWGSQLFAAARRVAGRIWDGFKSGLGIKSPSYIEEAIKNILSESHDMVKAMEREFEILGRLSVRPDVSLAGMSSVSGVAAPATAAESVTYGDVYHITIDGSKMPSSDFEGLIESIRRAKRMYGKE